ncbi:Poly(U)-specific endoribonuclease [Aphelenchoides fujianensis]|nr:Poly(U)-specific endoribonuclease [Aphelenchoides fujianensis]
MQAFIFLLFVLVNLQGIRSVKVIPRCAKEAFRTNAAFQALVNPMYAHDNEKPGPHDIRVDKTNYLGKNKLFHVNPTLLTKPSYKALLRILDFYYGSVQVKNWDELFDPFLDVMMGSNPFVQLAGFFKTCEHPWFVEPTGEDAEGKEISRKDHIKAILKDLWFTPKYSGGGIGLRAFTHVFVGEVRHENNEASGLHNWLSFYYRENLPNNPIVFTEALTKWWFDVVTTVAFKIPTATQKEFDKKATGMLTMTSPAFEFALYTAAVMFRGSAGEDTKVTPVTILDCRVDIYHGLLYEIGGEIKIRTAYPKPAYDDRPWPSQCKLSYDLRKGKTCPAPLPADGA